MGKTQQSRLTLADLLQRKAQREADKPQCKDVYVRPLGGCLSIRKLPLAEFLNLMDQVDEEAGLRESLDFEAQLIYRCCPLLQERQLQEEYGCAEPTDIVYRLFEDDLGAIGDTATAIMDFYGMGDAVREQLKN